MSYVSKGGIIMPAGGKGTKKSANGRKESGIAGMNFSKDEQTFMKVVENSMGEKTFAYVPDVRDKLGWSKEKTDNMFRNLRDRGVIQPMTASLEDMTDAQAEKFLKNSFMDEGLGKRRTAVKLMPKERWKK